MIILNRLILSFESLFVQKVHAIGAQKDASNNMGADSLSLQVKSPRRIPSLARSLKCSRRKEIYAKTSVSALVRIHTIKKFEMLRMKNTLQIFCSIIFLDKSYNVERNINLPVH